MSTLTIPKKLAAQDDLIIVPRKDYESLLRISKTVRSSLIYKELLKALSEIKRGEITGPFYSAKELRQSLER